MNRKKWTKAALALSACLFVLWWALGTGATLAWFSDTDTVRNEFQIGLLKMNVSYKNDIVKEYTPLEGSTEVFYDEALYEPGYTQVVYLKIENTGNVAFDYKLSVTVDSVITATSVLGNEIYLPNYLCFGAVFAESEDALKAKVLDRLTARDQANMQPLSTWSEVSQYTFEADDEPHYVALIVYMLEEVGNAANHSGGTAPQIKLGIAVKAQQSGTMN